MGCLDHFESSSWFRVANIAAQLRGGLHRATWKAFAVTVAIWAAMNVVFFVETVDLERYPTMSFWGTHLSGAIINLCMAVCMMYSTLVADEITAAGGKRLPVYAGAVVIGSAVGAFAQWQAHQWMHLLPFNNDVGSSNPIYNIADDPYQAAVTVTQPVVMFFEYLIWGSIIVFTYANRRNALLVAARASAAQIERTHVQQRALQLRLQTLQARVEPQFLFSTLAHVRDLYEVESESAGRMLDDLMVYLRAALPHMRDAMSNLERELRLIDAYLSIMRVRLGERFDFSIDASKPTLVMRIPSMILLPLVEHCLPSPMAATDASCALDIVATTSADKLRIEISNAGSGCARGGAGDVLEKVRDRLDALYGKRCSLSLEASEGYCNRMVMEIPLETADGDHR